jgi:hypothetical protein
MKCKEHQMERQTINGQNLSLKNNYHKEILNNEKI